MHGLLLRRARSSAALHFVVPSGRALRGAEENVCAPISGSRSGDGGLCERRCQASSDCVEGLAECAPTGNLLASGEREGGCWFTATGGFAIEQRLSLEEMRLAVVPSLAVAVRSNSSTSVPEHELVASEAGVCVRGRFGSLPGEVSLAYRFATADGKVSGGTDSQGLAITLAATQATRLEAFQRDEPGTPYEVRRGWGPRLMDSGEYRAQWLDFASEGERFDPSKLESLLFRMAGAGGVPFELCVGSLQFEP